MERVSSEDSRLRRREVREVAYSRLCSFLGDGNTPRSVAWVGPTSPDVPRGGMIPSKPRKRPPNPGIVGGFGIMVRGSSSNSQGVPSITSTTRIQDPYLTTDHA